MAKEIVEFLGMLADGRDFEFVAGNAEVEIFAEPPLFDSEREIFMGCGDEAHPAFDVALAFLQRAEERPLASEGERTDFVEEQRAAGGPLERAGRSEKLFVHGTFRNR